MGLIALASRQTFIHDKDRNNKMLTLKVMSACTIMMDVSESV